MDLGLDRALGQAEFPAQLGLGVVLRAARQGWFEEAEPKAFARLLEFGAQPVPHHLDDEECPGPFEEAFRCGVVGQFAREARLGERLVKRDEPAVCASKAEARSRIKPVLGLDLVSTHRPGGVDPYASNSDCAFA